MPLTFILFLIRGTRITQHYRGNFKDVSTSTNKFKKNRKFEKYKKKKKERGGL